MVAWRQAVTPCEVRERRMALLVKESPHASIVVRLPRTARESSAYCHWLWGGPPARG